MKKTAVLVCPGRGTYNKSELGSIQRLHNDKAATLQQFDQARTALGLAKVSELDQQPHYSSRVHQQAENAAGLIFAAGVLDYQSIDVEKYDIVAITGNSMGWYTALCCAGSWQPKAAMQHVSHMARLTANAAGAQCIYPVVNAEWQPDAAKQQAVRAVLAKYPGELFPSIQFGGYAVLAGTEAAVHAAVQQLPKVDDRFPMILPGHAGFHSPLMQEAAQQALLDIPSQAFNRPQQPLIDGCGHIWQPFSTTAEALQRYTLDRQVQGHFDFSLALEVAMKEFAPDHVILLGPGSGLGGAVAQTLIRLNWQGIDSKQDFVQQQASNQPLVLSMAIPEQRALLLL
ncbi:malonyl CoA-ACP transacylase [Alkalimonas collagenimarina]|uniref:[acyl-carrier-protein] S-malonyltransferase n=1 Tax=Alkalimonas collagenimarina TaxID=400390 RepID=A0ABT9GVB7_9GAMM|nr:malonyl CoA-ACP transacylase [Alkalimonas collagenimarina]MDP4534995.1 malonyl CoA-ACP transacylase [Alkalimonas collagenimarina]